MPLSDFQLVFQWWSALFLVGVAAYPLTKRLFSNWYDRGYFFSKAVGMAVVTYLIFLAGTLRVAPFTINSIYIALIGMFVAGFILHLLNKEVGIRNNGKRTSIHYSSFIIHFNTNWKQIVLIIFEELFFFLALLSWSWVKAHEPSIQGLEKFMDYGFMQSLLHSVYFPAPDMWWAGGTINYYFFGHLVTAVLTKLSGLDLSVTFNLMLATLFALTATMSFGIGVQLSVVSPDSIGVSCQSSDRLKAESRKLKALLSGLLTSFLVTLAGNMQTLYAFTKGYVGDNVVPFWTILWKLSDIGGVSGIWDGTLVGKLGEGMNRYWYANATRFIPYTIHEFPSYSFVVSDVHGHVLSIPFVLLAIGLLIQLSVVSRQLSDSLKADSWKLKAFIFYGFLLGVLLMTNALSGPIYLLLFVAVLLATNKSQISNLKSQTNFKFQISNFKLWGITCIPIVSVIGLTILTALPFLWHFSSFASGIGVNCPLSFLANSHIGPLLFETVEKCQKSPLWMMTLLWGFFWFTGTWLFVKQVWGKDQYDNIINRILKVFYLYSIFLIIVPEFFYVKDIYPAHFRSNTMFKLGYEAFILWSIVAGYVIVHFIFNRRQKTEDREQITESRKQKTDKRYWIVVFRPPSSALRPLFFLLLLPQLFLVSIYPLFSIRSYFGELKTYRSIDGLEWLRKEYGDDYEAIVWLKQAVSSQLSAVRQSEGRKLTPIESGLKTDSLLPVIVEADGESYTDYNHISAFSGVPTIVGWGVHEWLWRGGYDEVGPRREEVRTIYTSSDATEVRGVLEKYRVRYIIVGRLEREKYPDVNEAVFQFLGTLVFQSGETNIYEVGGGE